MHLWGQSGYTSIALAPLREFLYYRLSTNVTEFRSVRILHDSECLIIGISKNKVTGYRIDEWNSILDKGRYIFLLSCTYKECRVRLIFLLRIREIIGSNLVPETS